VPSQSVVVRLEARNPSCNRDLWPLIFFVLKTDAPVTHTLVIFVLILVFHDFLFSSKEPLQCTHGRTSETLIAAC